jgi:hypothetical protein
MLLEFTREQLVGITLPNFIEVIGFGVTSLTYCCASSRFLSSCCQSVVVRVCHFWINCGCVAEILTLYISVMRLQENTLNEPKI